MVEIFAQPLSVFSLSTLKVLSLLSYRAVDLLYEIVKAVASTKPSEIGRSTIT